MCAQSEDLVTLHLSSWESKYLKEEEKKGEVYIFKIKPYSNAWAASGVVNYFSIP